MKLIYDPEADLIYIDLSANPGIDSHEISDGVDVDAGGNPVDIDHASQKLNLTTLETVALPGATTKMTA